MIAPDAEPSGGFGLIALREVDHALQKTEQFFMVVAAVFFQGESGHRDRLDLVKLALDVLRADHFFRRHDETAPNGRFQLAHVSPRFTGILQNLNGSTKKSKLAILLLSTAVKNTSGAMKSTSSPTQSRSV